MGHAERVESREARAIVNETPVAALRENGPVAPRKRERKASVRAHPQPSWPKAGFWQVCHQLASCLRGRWREVAVKGELVRYGPSAWVARALRTWFARPALSRSTAITLGRCTVGYRTLPVYPKAATSRRGRGDDFYGYRLGRPVRALNPRGRGRFPFTHLSGMSGVADEVRAPNDPSAFPALPGRSSREPLTDTVRFVCGHHAESSVHVQGFSAGHLRREDSNRNGNCSIAPGFRHHF